MTSPPDLQQSSYQNIGEDGQNQQTEIETTTIIFTNIGQVDCKPGYHKDDTGTCEPEV